MESSQNWNLGEDLHPNGNNLIGFNKSAEQDIRRIRHIQEINPEISLPFNKTTAVLL